MPIINYFYRTKYCHDLSCPRYHKLLFLSSEILTESPCGGTLSSPSLLSYKDTNGEWFYNHMKDCLWTLVALEDKIVLLYLVVVDIDCDRSPASIWVSFISYFSLLDRVFYFDCRSNASTQYWSCSAIK